MQQEHLSAFIGDVYQAGLDPARWQGVLAAATRFVGGASATLFSKTAGRAPGLLVYEHGIAQRFQRLYIDQYVKLDPAPTAAHYTSNGAATTRRFFAELEQPIATSDLASRADFLETRFYREWARPQGVVDFVGAALDNSVASAAMFGVFRHERNGLTDDETRRRMRLIVPHIRRALMMTRELETRAFQAETLAVAFDGLSAGMIVVDANADVVYANRAGQAILRAGDMLRVLGGRLAAADPAADQILREAFAKIAEAGGLPFGRRGAVVPLIGRGGERHLAHVLPLTPGTHSRASICPEAAAALFVHRAALDTAESHALAKAYRLTPTELRVLRAVAEIGGLPEVAAAFGVSESTVRTHVRRLFEKLGVNRQADLVKIIAGFSNPLLVD